MINKAKSYLGIDVNNRHKLMDYYNQYCYPLVNPKRKYKIKYSDDWCAMFTSVIAHKCGMSPKNFPYEVSVYYQYEWAIADNRWFTDASRAKPNDLIVYDWNKGNRFNHVGFVVSNVGGVITAIEGNKDKTVAYRKVSANSKQIKGFISVDYNQKQVDMAVSDAENKQDAMHRLRIALLAIEVLKGRYSDGLERKQALGVDYAEVQDLINK